MKPKLAFSINSHFWIVILFCILGNNGYSQTIKNLSEQNWYLWPDKEAAWKHDELFLPPVDISKLPVNPPTCGWSGLSKMNRTKTTLPATVEEYYWGNNGNAFGVAGNYVGVSWFSTSVNIPEDWKGQTIALNFESVRLRSEIYVNHQLAGYDLINGTPFSVDISKFVLFGKPNAIDVRITDPNGNFAWRDWETYSWGNYEIPPSHGFGGITGQVELEAHDQTYIDDVFVKNGSKVNTIEVSTRIAESYYKKLKGRLDYSIRKRGSEKVLLSRKTSVDLNSNEQVFHEKLSLKNPSLWSPDSPNLYVLETNWEGSDGSTYKKSVNFGFRYFEVKEVNGDRQFFLNGKRIVLRTAISWGHWPVNGIFPTPELARKQIKVAKELGLNMLNFHRGIGQSIVLNDADEMGLLYYEEPGGYKPGDSEFTIAFKHEKLKRMVERDRSHPSLIIYSMINEANRDPKPNELADMKMAHHLDDSRIITFTSTYFGKRFHNGHAPLDTAAVKMHMLPGDSILHYYGWWDEHHAGGPGVYRDNFYNGPNDIYRNYDDTKEIIFLGEEGAIGTSPRLGLIDKEYNRIGRNGWDGDTYKALYKAYDDYLTNKDFRKAFPTVDSLATAIGKVSYYYQGRVIENVRIGNLLDGYAVNGWEGTKVENHSGIVDIFRNPKSNVQLLARYNQPLYVAVKIRNKVLETGDSSLVDFFVVNEKNLHGKYKLQISVEDQEGTFFNSERTVNLTGGTTYGELLLSGISITPNHAGYSTVKAQLVKNKQVVASGDDQFYAVSLNETGLPDVVVADSSGKVQKLLDEVGIHYIEERLASLKDGQVLIVGKDMQPEMVPGQFRQTSPVMDWVSRGNTMLVIDGVDAWGTYLNQKEIADFRGTQDIGRNWFGGNYFVRENPLFSGLPVNTAFNWEYQFLAGYNRDRVGMRMMNGKSMVGVTADHKREVYDAVVVLPHGRGRIILSALDLMALLKDHAKSGVVARRILENYIKYGPKLSFEKLGDGIVTN